MLDRLKRRIRPLITIFTDGFPDVRDRTVEALLRPTAKQKEAMGRYGHTISSASLIGFFTLLVAGKWTAWTPVQAFLLLFIAVLLFIVGTILSEGE